MRCPRKDRGVLRARIDHSLRDFHKFRMAIQHINLLCGKWKVSMKLFVTPVRKYEFIRYTSPSLFFIKGHQNYFCIKKNWGRIVTICMYSVHCRHQGLHWYFYTPKNPPHPKNKTKRTTNRKLFIVKFFSSESRKSQKVIVLPITTDAAPLDAVLSAAEGTLSSVILM